MRIEFITEDDLYVLPLFQEFFRNFASEFEIMHVSCCRVMGSRGRGKLLRELISLYGIAGFSRLAARFLAASLLSRFPGRPNARRYYSLAQLCAAYNVPYTRIENPNHEDFVSSVQRRSADLLISVACPYILKRRLLETPPMGCINLHNAPLPRYKGMMPTFWQMFHGESAVGLTIHYMTETIDDGAVLLQDRLEIGERETLDQVIRRSKTRAAHSLSAVLRQLRDGDARPAPLSKENSSYFSFPKLTEIREFRRRGLRAI